MGTVGIAASHSGAGYNLADADGAVAKFGDAGFYGSMLGAQLNKPMVGMAATPSGNGYWEVAADGGIFTFGDAGFFGSLGGQTLSSPIVGMAPTSNGQGYWLAAANGGVFMFGNAAFFGSMLGAPLNKPMVGMAATPTGLGYWFVAADGGVFTFGDAGFFGSMGGSPLNKPMVGMVPTSSGQGYWLVAADGGIFTFGDAGFFGSLGGQSLSSPIVGMAATPDGLGYWLAAADGHIFKFGSAVHFGNIFPPGRPERTCVVLCRFRDAAGALTPVVANPDFYRAVFFGRQVGGSLHDFYADVTHGAVDVLGDVFGWLDIAHTVAEHEAAKFQAQRIQAFNWGRQAALDAGIDFDGYPRQVVIINRDSDWGGVSKGHSMMLPHTPTTTWSLSRTAHEFGHVLDLDDAFGTSKAADGTMSDARYQDWNCVMSYETTGSRFQLPFLGQSMQAGPGLNGVYTNALGGIPASRIATVPAVGAALTITLAPLSHGDQSGALLVKVPPTTSRPNTYFVELHDKSNWDRAIASSRVTVHEARQGNGISFALGLNGAQDMDSSSDPAFFTPDGSIGIRLVSKSGLNAAVRVWELGPTRAQQVRVSSMVVNPPGDDVEGERVVIRNDRGTTAVLTGWTLRDALAHPASAPWRFDFPNFALAPGEDVTVWTKSGHNDAHNLYWGLNHAVWNNQGGDAAVLSDDSGAEISRLSYP